MEEFVRTFFVDHGLWALFVLMVLDNIGVPLPSEIPLLLAGLFVSQGDMNYLPATLIAAAGSLAGALVLYTLGRTVGRAVATRWGRIVRVSAEDIDRAEAWFHRRGEPAVLYLRVVPLVRTVISIPAGMLEMSIVRFVAYTFGGSLAWCLAVIGLGVALGDGYERVLGGFGLASVAAASVVAMLVFGWVLKRWLASRARDSAQKTPPRA